MISSYGFASALFIAGFAACAGSQPAASTSPTAPVASDASAQPTPAPPPSASAPTPPAPVADTTPPPAPAPPPAPPLMPICQAKCDKLVAKCSKASIESCRLNCGKYDPPPAGCGAQVQAALECARDAKNLSCANIAPESCSAKFRAIVACSSGVAAQKPNDAPAALPDGWERYTDTLNGFIVALPQGSAEKSATERAVTVGDTTYSVSVLPVPTAKPSEKTLLRWMMKIQGRCSDKLKLDGFIENASGASIHYLSKCPDKTEWNGMLYIGPKHLIMLSARAPLGKVGITEPFFYGFKSLTP